MTSTSNFASAVFERDIALHQMQVIRDDGVNRHLRFSRPGTTTMHFDLVTWPGHLCYTGDMGTYVFRRLEDMFEFFRHGENKHSYSIDLRYWAEKLQASDIDEGAQKWTEGAFRAAVLDFFKQATDDPDDWSAERKADLWKEIDDDVLSMSGDGEHDAWVALRRFEHDGFRFQDWDRDCKEWTHGFLWCCHALQWAIGTYDQAKEPNTERQRSSV